MARVQSTGLYDARFTTLTDQVKKLGKAQAVAQEIVVLDVRACVCAA